MSASLEQSRQQLLHSAAELGEHAGGEGLETFLQGYYRHVATEDLLARAPEDLLGAAAHHQELAKTRPIGTVNVEVFNPEVEEQGWASGHSIVQIVTDDMPFLVDSVTAELTRMGRAVHLIVHPLVVVRRNAAGELEEIIGQGARDSGVETSSGGGFGVVRESWMHVEVDRESDPSDREEIATNLRRVLSDVREAVEDWPKMKAKCTEIAEELKADPPAGIPEPEVEQTRRLLDWLANNHFTFLGYREYHLAREDGTDVLTAVRGSGLGLLRYDSSNEGVRLSRQASAVAREPKLLIVTKANSRATVHRSTYLDYVGIKTFDEQGEVVGEKRFLGLFTSTAYTESVTRIPVLQDKIDAIFERTGFAADSHSGKDLLEVLETYPRDELFQADQDELHDNATAVLHLQERRKTRLFLRKDEFGRFMSCLVYIPRDRYNTAVRLRMEQILRTAFEGASVDYTTRVSESALARLHFVVRVAQGQRDPRGRRGRPREAAGRRHPHVGRGPRRGGAHRARGGGCGAPHRPLRQGLPRGLQGGLHPPRRGRRHPPHGGPRHRGVDRPQHVPGARRPEPRAPVQALPPRPAVADPGAADVHAPRRRGRRRAALRDLARRRRHRPHLRLRPARAQREGLDRRLPRPHARAVPGCRSGRCGTAMPSPTASTPSCSAPG